MSTSEPLSTDDLREQPAVEQWLETAALIPTPAEWNSVVRERDAARVEVERLRTEVELESAAYWEDKFHASQALLLDRVERLGECIGASDCPAPVHEDGCWLSLPEWERELLEREMAANAAAAPCTDDLREQLGRALVAADRIEGGPDLGDSIDAVLEVVAPLLAAANGKAAEYCRLYQAEVDRVAELTRERDRARADLVPYEALTPQRCENGIHAEWLADTEYAIACPWCQIDALKAGRPSIQEAPWPGTAHTQPSFTGTDTLEAQEAPEHADDCQGCEHIPGAIHFTGEPPAPRVLRDRFGQLWADDGGHHLVMTHDSDGSKDLVEPVRISRAKVEHRNGPLTEVASEGGVNRRGSFPVTKALCSQHSGIDPAPSDMMLVARKRAVERLCAENWETYRTYLNDAIAEVREQLRVSSGGDGQP